MQKVGEVAPNWCPLRELGGLRRKLWPGRAYCALIVFRGRGTWYLAGFEPFRSLHTFVLGSLRSGNNGKPHSPCRWRLWFRRNVRQKFSTLIVPPKCEGTQKTHYSVFWKPCLIWHSNDFNGCPVLFCTNTFFQIRGRKNTRSLTWQNQV